MAKKTVFIVFHTTDNGADYKVSRGFNNRMDAIEWEHQHRDEFKHPLIIRKITY